MDVVSFGAANTAASGSVAAAPSTESASSATSIADPQSAPAPSTPGGLDQSDTLHKLVSQFYGSSTGNGSGTASGAPRQTIAVSFQVATDPNEIVTVFRDTKTNEVIAQFPPEIMVKIAEFFNKLSGATLDQKV